MSDKTVVAKHELKYYILYSQIPATVTTLIEYFTRKIHKKERN